MTLGTRTERAIAVVVAVPAVAMLGLLVYSMVSRLGYAYDLEWMEGGLLAHSQRLADGDGIYVPPSVDFIPYLYTPLYPALIALIGKAIGVSYLLGRAISIVATLATLLVIVRAIALGAGRERRAAVAGAFAAIGLYAATYPWVEAWFDLVRADALFVAMVVAGLFGVVRWARRPGPGGLVGLAAAAYLLSLAFFCKQTGVLFCAAGGGLVLVLAPRRAPLYAAVCAVVGLGGTWLFQRATGGWFWTYVYQVHQVHDFSRDRFVSSFGAILGHFPAMTGAIAVGLLATVAGALRQRRLPAGAVALVTWTPLFAIACVAGALGWATQWAHVNAYMPAMAIGAIAAGAALPAIASSLDLGPHPVIGGPARRTIALAASAAIALWLAVDIGRSAWRPARFIPPAADAAAGDKLIARLRATPGEVFVPFHPWYARLAGKPLHVHRMGVLDVTYGRLFEVAGLREALASHRFSLVVFDDRRLDAPLSAIGTSYRNSGELPADERPRTYSGARVSPRTLWVPK